MLPWSVLHIDGVANLVVACRKCNSSKSDSLPDLQHVDRAISRNPAKLNEIAAQVEYGPDIDEVKSPRSPSMRKPALQAVKYGGAA